MAHNLMEDDANIIKKCHDYGFCCTYDAESKFRHESVKDAIAAVLASRSSQSEKLGRLIAGTDKVMGRCRNWFTVQRSWRSFLLMEPVRRMTVRM